MTKLAAAAGHPLEAQKKSGGGGRSARRDHRRRGAARAAGIGGAFWVRRTQPAAGPPAGSLGLPAMSFQPGPGAGAARAGRSVRARRARARPPRLPRPARAAGVLVDRLGRALPPAFLSPLDAQALEVRLGAHGPARADGRHRGAADADRHPQPGAAVLPAAPGARAAGAAPRAARVLRAAAQPDGRDPGLHGRPLRVAPRRRCSPRRSRTTSSTACSTSRSSLISALVWWPLIEPNRRRLPGDALEDPLHRRRAAAHDVPRAWRSSSPQTPFYTSFYGTGDARRAAYRRSRTSRSAARS